MFHFPAYTPTRPIHSGAGNKTLLLLGSPIRKPSDQSLSDSSPRLIAVHHVLHRPLVPRHPPNAHKNNTQHRQTTPQNPPQQQQDPGARHTTKTHHREQRYSRPLYSSQPTHPHQTNNHKQVTIQSGGVRSGALLQNPDSMPSP